MIRKLVAIVVTETYPFTYVCRKFISSTEGLFEKKMVLLTPLDREGGGNVVGMQKIYAYM